MSRFDDLLPSFADELTHEDSALKHPFAEPLRWEVTPNNGTPPYEIDLTDFSVGSSASGITSRANLILQLAPAIRLNSHGRAKHYKHECRHRLKSYWQFLDSLVSATGGDITDLSQIGNSHGALFKVWLLRSAGLSLPGASHIFRSIYAIIRLARETCDATSRELLWPTIIFPRGTLHADVDQLALKQLYRRAKELHRGFRSAEDEGRALLASAESARTTRPESSSKYSLNEEAALTALEFLQESLKAPQIHFHESMATRLRGQKSTAGPRFIAPLDRKPFDALRWFVPGSEDVMAAFLMVLLHTGWNPETVLAIDVTADENWFDDRFEGASPADKTATVAIYSQKGKTGREQIAFCLKRPWSHPYSVIKYILRRTEVLREQLKRNLRNLEIISQPNFDERKAIAKLRGMIKSPWLYYISSGNITYKIGGRIGALSSSYYRQPFKQICKSAETSIMEKDINKKEKIIAGLHKLKPSDARDGFASFIFDSSLYNILLMKHALGHGSIRATRHYIRQKNQMLGRFSQFLKFQDAVFEEVRNHRTIDPTILFIRLTVGEVTADQRERLADHRMRTRMNMGCLAPTEPPPEFVKPGSGGVCRIQRCTLCRHGVVFDDSFSAIAKRQAELAYIRSRCSSASFENSTFSVEWAAIRVLIDNVFPQKRDLIEAETSTHLQKLRNGSVYLFDQVPADFEWEASGAAGI